MYALIAYWFIFWQRFLRNPYLLSTSEVASTNFPHWVWMGKGWRATDSVYYKYPACIPFLSMWYWPNVLLARVCRGMKLDTAFKVYIYFMLAHYLLASMIAYKVMGLFGAITLTYSAFNIKPQTHSLVYTMCWMPGMLIPGWFGVFSCFMAITGGYWPILVYFMPVAAVVNPFCLLGIIPGLVQIVPFAWYLIRSNRWGKVESNERTLSDPKIGRIPWWKFKDLFWPTNDVAPTNGVHYPEVAMYMGIAVLFICKASWWWLALIVSVAICMGLVPAIQRIPARALYLLTFSVAFLTPQISGALLLFQCYLLLRNSYQYPSFPFSQWLDRPSKLYNRPMDGTWPNLTGYLINHPVSTYRGGFSLKEAQA